MFSSESERASPSPGDFAVVCLCAEWCGICRDYRSDFERLEMRFPGVRLLWRDIEEDAESLGDLDIENFPTILVRRGELVLFYGTMLPQVSHLARLIETFLEQTLEQSKEYAMSNQERAGWQANPDLSRIGQR